MLCLPAAAVSNARSRMTFRLVTLCLFFRRKRTASPRIQGTSQHRSVPNPAMGPNLRMRPALDLMEAIEDFWKPHQVGQLVIEVNRAAAVRGLDAA